MEVEEIINILGKVQNKYLIPVRTMKLPSSIAHSYRTYIMQLWEIAPDNEKLMLFNVEETGLYNDEHKKELVRKTEEKFYSELFRRYKECF